MSLFHAVCQPFRTFMDPKGLYYTLDPKSHLKMIKFFGTFMVHGQWSYYSLDSKPHLKKYCVWITFKIICSSFNEKSIFNLSLDKNMLNYCCLELVCFTQLYQNSHLNPWVIKIIIYTQKISSVLLITFCKPQSLEYFCCYQ